MYINIEMNIEYEVICTLGTCINEWKSKWNAMNK